MITTIPNLGTLATGASLSPRAGAGLVLQDKQGREVFDRVDLPEMRRQMGVLTSECRKGVAPRLLEDAA